MSYAHAHAPCRIGIAGGGTDLPTWTQGHIGLCLSIAIQRYAHAFAIKRRDGQAVAVYSEHVDRASCATEIGNGLVRESALLHGFESGFEVHTASEVPSRGTGLGASSSIAVALSACFERMRQVENPPLYLARSAWTVEIDRLHRPIGRQDHMAAAYGGLRLYRFERDSASVERTFAEEDAEWTARHLALVALSTGHDSRTLLADARPDFQAAFEAVDVAVRAIEQRDPSALGRALTAGQRSKGSVPGVAPAAVRTVLRRLETLPGVYGAKVCGAGGGGHIVAAIDRPEIVGEIAAATGLPAFQVEPDLAGVRTEGSP